VRHELLAHVLSAVQHTVDHILVVVQGCVSDVLRCADALEMGLVLSFLGVQNSFQRLLALCQLNLDGSKLGLSVLQLYHRGGVHYGWARRFELISQKLVDLRVLALGGSQSVDLCLEVFALSLELYH